MRNRAPLRLLSLVPEALPTFRPDVSILAGKYLPMHGVYSHFIGRSGALDSVTKATQDGVTWEVSSPKGRRWRQELNYCLLAVCRLLAASPSEYAFIQTRDMVSIGFLALLIARWKGIPFVYWMSFLMCEARKGHAREAFERGQLAKGVLLWLKARMETFLLYRFVLPNSQYVFVQSDAMKRHVAKEGIAEQLLQAVPMGVDLEGLCPAFVEPKRLPQHANSRLIGYLGTLDAQRNIGLLIDALLVVRESIPDAHLLLIGGSQNSHDELLLRARAKRLGLEDRVTITGWLPQVDAWRLLMGCDVCVSPIPRGLIFDVSSPTKLVEYMAFGLPCIGNDSPDQKRVLEESEAGWLVGGDPPDYSGALIQVLGDLDGARRRSSRGPGYVSRVRSYAVLSEKVAMTYKRLAGCAA